MKFLSPIIDKLQATFPPNRVAVALFLILAPAWAWLAKRGIELDPVTTIAVLAGALALLYKWLDGWQAGEPIDVEADLEADLETALNALQHEYETVSTLRGTTDTVGQALMTLRQRVTEAKVNDTEIANELEAIVSTLDLRESPEEPPEAQVVSPAPAAPPTAAE